MSTHQINTSNPRHQQEATPHNDDHVTFAALRPNATTINSQPNDANIDTHISLKRTASTLDKSLNPAATKFSKLVGKYTYYPEALPLSHGRTNQRLRGVRFAPNKKCKLFREPDQPLLVTVARDPMIQHKLDQVCKFIRRSKPHTFEKDSGTVKVPKRTLLGSLMRMRIDYGLGNAEESQVEIDLGEVRMYQYLAPVEQEPDQYWVSIDLTKVSKLEKEVRDKIGHVPELQGVNLLLVEVEMMVDQQFQLHQATQTPVSIFSESQISGGRAFFEQTWAKITKARDSVIDLTAESP